MDRRPELVLMDISLPGKRDGVDAAVEIFQRLGIRSIFASALADAAVKARAESARPLAWLAKPFNDRKLVATVESALDEVNALPQTQPRSLFSALLVDGCNRLSPSSGNLAPRGARRL